MSPQANQLSRDLLAGIIENSPDAISLVDETGTIVEWNPAAVVLTGIAIEAAAGRPFWEIQAALLPESQRRPAVLERQREAILEMCRTGKTPEGAPAFEVAFRRADGELRLVQQTLFAVPGPKGYLVGSISRDITDRRRAEDGRAAALAALELANEGLEARVAERTADLARAVRLYGALHAITTAINSTLDATGIMERAVSEARKALDCGSVVLLRRDADGWRIQAVDGLSSELAGYRIPPDEAVLTEEVVRRGDVLIVPDVLQAGPVQAPLAKRNIRSVLFAPLTCRAEVTGLVSFNYHGTPAALGEVESDFARKLAASISLGLENARLYAEARFQQERWEATVDGMLEPVTVCNAEGQSIYMNAAYRTWIECSIDPALPRAEQARSYALHRPDGTQFAPEELPLQRAALCDEAVRDVEVIQRTPSGAERLALWNASPLHGPDGRVLGAVAVGRDITEQRQTEAEHERLLRRLQGYAAELRTSNEQLSVMTQALQGQAQELQRAQAELEVRVWLRTRHLEILHGIDQAALAARSPSEIAHAALDHLRKLVPCQRAALVVFDFGASAARIMALDSDSDTAFQVGQQLPLESFGSFAERRPPEALLVGDLRAPRDLAPMQRALLSEGVVSHLWTPLAIGSKVVGVLGLGAAQANAFSAEQVEMTRQIADSLAVAIQNALLNEQVRESRAQLQVLSKRLAEDRDTERRQIAVQLYDDAGQRLAALSLGLGALVQQQGSDSARLDELRALASGILGDLHDLAVHLRPASLDRLGLVPALRQYAAGLAAQHHLKIQMETFGLANLALSRHVSDGLFWIAQELLDNVVRHSHAGVAGLILERREDRLVLIVEDDGVGFDPGLAMRQAGLGLFGVHERAVILGGDAAIESSPGRGSTIYVDVPYTAVLPN